MTHAIYIPGGPILSLFASRKEAYAWARKNVPNKPYVIVEWPL